MKVGKIERTGPANFTRKRLDRKAAPVKVNHAVDALVRAGWRFFGRDWNKMYNFGCGKERLSLDIHQLRAAFNNPPSPGTPDVRHIDTTRERNVYAPPTRALDVRRR